MLTGPGRPTSEFYKSRIGNALLNKCKLYNWTDCLKCTLQCSGENEFVGSGLASTSSWP